MTENPAPDTAPDLLADLPMQPTGSGVADLETAYEQMKLTERLDGESASPGVPDAGDSSAAGSVSDLESAAHPS